MSKDRVDKIKEQRGLEANISHARGNPLPVYTEVTVNAVENGVLLRSDLHSLFDAWLWTVDPVKSLAVLPHSLSIIDSSYLQYDRTKRPSARWSRSRHSPQKLP
jgi:hypothetical protein